MSRLRSAGSQIVKGSTARSQRAQFTDVRQDVLRSFQQDYFQFRNMLDSQFQVPKEHRLVSRQQKQFEFLDEQAKAVDNLRQAQNYQAAQLIRRQNQVIGDLQNKMKTDRQMFVSEIDKLRSDLLNQASFQPRNNQPGNYPSKNPIQNRTPSRPQPPPREIPPPSRQPTEQSRRPLNKSKPPKKRYKLKKYVHLILFGLYYKRLYKKKLQDRRSNMMLFFKDNYQRAYQNIIKQALEHQSVFLSNLLDEDRLDLDCELNLKEDPQITQTKIKYLFQLIQTFFGNLKALFLSFDKEILNFLKEFIHPHAFLPKNFLYSYELKRLSFEPKQGYLRQGKSQSRLLLTTVILIRILVFGMILRPQKLEPSLVQTENFKTKVKVVCSLIYHATLIYIQERIDKQENVFAQKKSIKGNWEKVDVKYRPEPLRPLQAYPSKADSPVEIVSGLFPKQYFIELIQFGGGKAINRILNNLQLGVEFLLGRLIERRGFS